MTRSNFDLSLYGGPGSGKSTQAELLVKKLKLTHLNMGGELRKLAKGRSALSTKVRHIIDHGKLVPVEVVEAIVEKFVKAHPHDRLLLDGVSRNLTQTRVIEKVLNRYGRNMKLIFLHLSATEAKRRLALRAQVQGRKDDTDKQAMQTRFDVFHARYAPILERYKKQGNLIKIDAKGTQTQVITRILKAIKDVERN